MLSGLLLVGWTNPQQPITRTGVGPPGAEGGTHYIVLIDDSGDMDGQRRPERIASAVPWVLFEGFDTAPAPDLPRFSPDKDLLSIAYFTIHADNQPADACKAEKALSVLPKHLLQWEKATAEPLDQAALQRYLTESLSRDCRFNGRLSPIASSDLMALPGAQANLAPGRLFDRTILLMATNDAYNTKASPTAELTSLEREQHVRDAGQARNLAYRVSQFFRLDSPPEWTIGIDASGRPLVGSGSADRWLRASDVVPIAPSAPFWYPREVALDRTAVSKDAVILAPGTSQPMALHIPVIDRLKPLYLTRSITATDGKPWTVGGKEPVAVSSIDLQSCLPAWCRHEDGNLIIPFLAPFDQPFALTSQDADDPGSYPPAKLRFRTTYLLDTGGVYDHVRIDGPPGEVTLVAAPAQVVAASSMFGAERVTNAVLRREWTTSDDAGLSEATAVERILARRPAEENLRRGVEVVAALLLLILVLFLLYRFFYRRRFDPELQWIGGAPLTVDFDKAAANRLLVGTLRVRNRGEVPFFGRLLRNREQPECPAEVTAQAPDLAALGLDVEVASDVPIGFVNPLNPNGPLVLNLAGKVFHGQQFFLFLEAAAIRDFHAPSGSEGWLPEQLPASPEIPPALTWSLPVTVRMCWMPTKNLPEVDAIGEATDEPVGEANMDAVPAAAPRRCTERVFEMSLTVLPETSRPPRVSFVQDNAPCYYDGGVEPERHLVPLGTYSLASTAEHDYSFPFDDELGMDVTCESRPLPRGAALLRPPNGAFRPQNGRTTVRWGETVALEALLDCSQDFVVNPDPAAHAYGFVLTGHFSQDSNVKREVAHLHRDPTPSNIALHLRLGEGDLAWEVYWEEGHLRLRGADETADGASRPAVQGDVITLPAADSRFREETDPLTLFSYTVGNTGRHGRGYVPLDAASDLASNSANLPGRPWLADLRLRAGAKTSDLVRTWDQDQAMPNVRVAEGDPDAQREVKLDTRQVRAHRGRSHPGGGLSRRRGHERRRVRRRGPGGAAARTHRGRSRLPGTASGPQLALRGLRHLGHRCRLWSGPHELHRPAAAAHGRRDARLRGSPVQLRRVRSFEPGGRQRAAPQLGHMSGQLLR
ncbi:MAG: hypothetical protein IPO51_14875 [Dehalococcoidia bacterium]|nr:hypothetical protein [Dehalococcoidia bacterium]